ncbi:MAG: DUF2141 domain-containing protein [Dinoroseobacter sp.]|nr:DUF2141 domain-containing protein [Dinoroseobacter sp.]
MQSAVRILMLSANLVCTAVAAGEIDLTMTGFGSDEGMARVVLMRGNDSYTGDEPVTLTSSVPIHDGTAYWSAEVPPGAYAIIAHHDRNTNNALDRPILQLPLEPYGYSNGAWTSIGLPGFDDVAFTVGEGIAPQRITMRMNSFVTLIRTAAAGVFALVILVAVIAIHRRCALRYI